jgi:peptide/nickel transport system permease protein
VSDAVDTLVVEAPGEGLAVDADERRRSGVGHVFRTIWSRVGYTTSGRVGTIMLIFIVVVAVFGPLLAPHTIIDVVGIPYSAPSSAAPIGTDFLGRDALSRFLQGGRVLLVVAFASTTVAYICGGLVGLLAGYRRGWLGSGVIWVVDVFLSIPAIILALAMIAAIGPGVGIVGVAVTAVLIPPIVRVVRIVTIEVSTYEYVEAAIARGENTWSIMVREILPNVRIPVSADFGIRLSWSIILYASLSFLGFGRKAPAADWGLMIAENRDGLLVSPWPLLVPAIAIALLAISVNLVADSIARSIGRSIGSR